MKWIGIWAAVTGSAAVFAAGGGGEGPPRVPPGHLPAYFERKPDVFLSDPQALLDADQRRDREKFLSYHADDSEIDFRILLFGNGQVIPQDVRAEELAERFFNDGKPTLLALYFLGQPDRVELQLSPGLAAVVASADLARLREQAVEAAAARATAAGQLEDFCIQMAIGIFWIERKAGLEPQPAAADPPRSGRSPPPERPAQARLLALLESWWAEWGVPAAVIAGGILAGVFARGFLRRRARHRFPESLPPPRLGGPHGAGMGALIEFRTSTRSPSSQKGEPDDSLGGL